MLQGRMPQETVAEAGGSTLCESYASSVRFGDKRARARAPKCAGARKHRGIGESEVSLPLLVARCRLNP